MTNPRKARAIGINHVALEVDDVDAAIEFYRDLVELDVHSRNEEIAFVYLGDQFINFTRGRRQARDDERHFGLVVDDKEAVREALERRGIEILPGRFLDFYDPWGNRVEIVSYQGIQFTKAPHVLRGMGVADLPKSEAAIAELAAKGMEP